LGPAIRISIFAALLTATLLAAAALSMPGLPYVPPSGYGWNYIVPRPFSVGRDGARYGVFTDQFQWHRGLPPSGSLLSPLIELVLESALGPAETRLASTTMRPHG
jgi:hypothetical protein